MYVLTEEETENVAGGWIQVLLALISVLGIGVAGWFASEAAEKDCTSQNITVSERHYRDSDDGWGNITSVPSTKEEATRTVFVVTNVMTCDNQTITITPVSTGTNYQ